MTRIGNVNTEINNQKEVVLYDRFNDIGAYIEQINSGSIALQLGGGSVIN